MFNTDTCHDTHSLTYSATSMIHLTYKNIFPPMRLHLKPSMTDNVQCTLTTREIPRWTLEKWYAVTICNFQKSRDVGKFTTTDGFQCRQLDGGFKYNALLFETISSRPCINQPLPHLWIVSRIILTACNLQRHRQTQNSNIQWRCRWVTQVDMDYKIGSWIFSRLLIL